jgi:hypothetical protein
VTEDKEISGEWVVGGMEGDDEGREERFIY